MNANYLNEHFGAAPGKQQVTGSIPAHGICFWSRFSGHALNISAKEGTCPIITKVPYTGWREGDRETWSGIEPYKDSLGQVC